MKLLLVDDDSFLRDMYATKFEEHKHEVFAAKNGEEALRYAEEHEFDVILMDMVMPGMSGVDLLNNIREKGVSKDAKCIVLSNQGEQSDIDAATEAGAVGYIIKADSIPSQVVTKVEALIV